MRLSRNRKNVNAAKVRERRGGGREREREGERGPEREFGEGQGSLACCSSWDHKESDTI